MGHAQRIGSETLDLFKIYKITNNINNKVYIGQTRYNINIRFKQHLKLVESNKNQLIYKAIKKYGKENFRIELLEECSSEIINDREKYYINLYKYNSYNINLDGYRTRSRFDEKQICSSYIEGKSCRKIAEEFNLSHNTILSILESCGIERRKKDSVLNKNKCIVTNELKKLIILDIQNKMTRLQITEKYNCSKATITRVLREYNLGATTPLKLYRTY